MTRAVIESMVPSPEEYQGKLLLRIEEYRIQHARYTRLQEKPCGSRFSDEVLRCCCARCHELRDVQMILLSLSRK